MRAYLAVTGVLFALIVTARGSSPRDRICCASPISC